MRRILLVVVIVLFVMPLPAQTFHYTPPNAKDPPTMEEMRESMEARLAYKENWLRAAEYVAYGTGDKEAKTLLDFTRATVLSFIDDEGVHPVECPSGVTRTRFVVVFPEEWPKYFDHFTNVLYFHDENNDWIVVMAIPNVGDVEAGINLLTMAHAASLPPDSPEIEEPFSWYLVFSARMSGLMQKK